MRYLNKVVLIFLVFISGFSFGQEIEVVKRDKSLNKQKNEIRIIFENFFNSNNLDLSYYSNNNQFVPIDDRLINYYNDKFRQGLGYNLNFNKIGLRSSVFYSNYDENLIDTRNATTNTKATLFRFSLGINYQKKLDKVVLFSGIDFGYFNFDTNMDKDTQLGTLSTQKTKYSGLSIQPLVGFKYFLSTNFSISTEIRIIIDKYKGSSSYYQNSSGLISNSNLAIKGVNVNLGPNGSISLNVHF